MTEITERTLEPVEIPVPDQVPVRAELPTPTETVLSNGLIVWHVPGPRTPLSAMRILVFAGSSTDRTSFGRAYAAATMLDEGAATPAGGFRGPLELAERLDDLGASLDISTGRDEVAIDLEVLESHLDAALAIAADCVLRPAFRSEDWQRTHALWLGELRSRGDDPRRVAGVVGTRAFYRDGHPYAHPPSGYLASAEALSLTDAKELYRSHYVVSNAIAIVTGGPEPAAWTALLEKHFGAWRDGDPVLAPPATTSGGNGFSLRLVGVDVPDAPQTVIRIALPAPSGLDTEVSPLHLATLALGGTFTSRLSMNLREENKFTYGARATLGRSRLPGAIVLESAVHAEKTGPALVEFLREIAAIGSSDLIAEEWDGVRATYSTRLTTARETVRGRLGLYTLGAVLGGGPSFAPAFAARTAASELRDGMLVSSARYRSDRATILLVGDRATIEAALEGVSRTESLGVELPPILFCDREGAPVE